jgi:hypothetical protein
MDSTIEKRESFENDSLGSSTVVWEEGSGERVTLVRMWMGDLDYYYSPNTVYCLLYFYFFFIYSYYNSITYSYDFTYSGLLEFVGYNLIKNEGKMKRPM